MAAAKLAYQRCEDCGNTQYLPRGHCARCHRQRVQWHYSDLQGHVHSYTVVYRAPTAEFRSMVPYVIALVDMTEGFRLMVNVLNCSPEAVGIGSAVRVIFPPTPGGKIIPQAELTQ